MERRIYLFLGRYFFSWSNKEFEFIEMYKDINYLFGVRQIETITYDKFKIKRSRIK